MKFCRYCGTKMKEVLSFSRDNRQRYNKCPKCHDETPQNKLTDKELEERFGKESKIGKKFSKY